MPKVSEEHKEEMRRKIREAAKGLFLEKGFREVTMKDIVVASGLSFGAVYSYYRNPSDIFLVLKQEEILEDDQNYHAMLVASSKEELIDFYLVFLEKRLTDIQKTLVPATYDYLTLGERNPHHQTISNIVYTQLDQQISRILKKAEKLGLIEATEIETATNFLLVYIEGVYFHQAFVGNNSIKQTLKHLGVLLNKLLGSEEIV